MNTELKTLINNLRDLCPKLKIDESSIMKPTPEFVLRFYSHILMEFEYSLLITISVGVDDNERDREETTLEPEQIYRQLSKILNQPTIKFKISDIYEPNFVRTKSFLKVFAHFYSFSLNSMEYIEQQNSDILIMRENMKEILKKKKNISEITSDNASKIARYLEETEELDKEIISLEKAFLEIEEHKIHNAEKQDEMRRQKEILSQEVEIEHSNLEKILLERNLLMEQTVSDEEYQNIIKMIESLENHMETMNSDPNENEDDFLTIANDALKHLKDCRKTLPDLSELHSFETVYKLIELREILNDLKLRIEKLVNNETHSEEKVEQAVEKFKIASNDYNNLKTTYEQDKLQISEKTERMVSENKKLQKQIRGDCNKIRKDIEQQDALFAKIETMKKKLLTFVCSEYNRLSEAQNVTFTNSYLMLDEIAKLYK